MDVCQAHVTFGKDKDSDQPMSVVSLTTNSYEAVITYILFLVCVYKLLLKVQSFATHRKELTTLPLH